jgi:hypothetical protein
MFVRIAEIVLKMNKLQWNGRKISIKLDLIIYHMFQYQSLISLHNINDIAGFHAHQYFNQKPSH